MRKLGIVAILVLSLLAGAVGLGLVAASAPSAVQEGEPTPDATVEVIAEPAESPSVNGDVNMVLYRLVVPAGVSVESHDHYDAAIWYVDSGTLSLTVEAGEVWVRSCEGGCAPSDVPPENATFELVEADTTVDLATGDWVIQHDTITHAYTNPGDIDTVILVSATYYESEGDGTPVATPAGGPRPRGCVGGCR